jgi:hypothetical protein
MSLMKFVMQPTLHLHLLCGFKTTRPTLHLSNLVKILLVASQILLGILLFLNHVVYRFMLIFRLFREEFSLVFKVIVNFQFF